MFNEKTPLDDNAKPQEFVSKTLQDKLNWMKGGIMASDRVLTVSPNYASEITSNPQKGVELDGFIRCAALIVCAAGGCAGSRAGASHASALHVRTARAHAHKHAR